MTGVSRHTRESTVLSSMSNAVRGQFAVGSVLWGFLTEGCAGEMENAVLEGDGSLASLFFMRKEGMFSAYAVYSRTVSRLGRGG